MLRELPDLAVLLAGLMACLLPALGVAWAVDHIGQKWRKASPPSQPAMRPAPRTRPYRIPAQRPRERYGKRDKGNLRYIGGSTPHSWR